MIDWKQVAKREYEISKGLMDMLHHANETTRKWIKTSVNLNVDVEPLRKENHKLKKENAKLKKQLYSKR